MAAPQLPPHSALADRYRELAQAAMEAAKNAYAPYSQKPQGAAVLTESGEIISAATVEIATYGHSISAEINAVSKAVSGGHRRFKAIAIDPYAHPSGLARQFIVEFGIDVDLVGIKDGKLFVVTLKELLPFYFGPENLQAEKSRRDQSGTRSGAE